MSKNDLVIVPSISNLQPETTLDAEIFFSLFSVLIIHSPRKSVRKHEKKNTYITVIQNKNNIQKRMKLIHRCFVQFCSFHLKSKVLHLYVNSIRKLKL